MTHSLNKIIWHDAQLVGLALSIDANGDAVLELRGFFYVSEDARERTERRITCEGVSRYNCTVSVSELKDNMGAGNVANGYLKKSTLWVYFCDGMLELDARTFEVA